MYLGTPLMLQQHCCNIAFNCVKGDVTAPTRTTPTQLRQHVNSCQEQSMRMMCVQCCCTCSFARWLQSSRPPGAASTSTWLSCRSIARPFTRRCYTKQRNQQTQLSQQNQCRNHPLTTPTQLNHTPHSCKKVASQHSQCLCMCTFASSLQTARPPGVTPHEHSRMDTRCLCIAAFARSLQSSRSPGVASTSTWLSCGSMGKSSTRWCDSKQRVQDAQRSRNNSAKTTHEQSQLS